MLVACFCFEPHSAGLRASLSVASSLFARRFEPLWETHLVGQFLHANLFHLLANVVVLWQLRFSLRNLAVAYLLSIPATLAVWQGTAIGFSSVLYALMGMRLAAWRLSRAEWAWFIAANVATAFVPGIAFGVHCAAFALGWIYIKVKGLWDEYRGACRRR